MKKTSLIVGAIGLVASAFVWLYLDLRRALIEANEPNVARLDPAHQQQHISDNGVRVRVSRVLNVNRDFQAWIFQGSMEDPKFTKLKGVEFALKGEDPETRRYGLIRASRDGQTIGVVLSTTRGEWRQGRPIFEEKWAALGSK